MLGRPAEVAAPRTPGAMPDEASAARAVVPAPVTLASGARLAVVPVAHSADPLVDTVPHPVVKLFPLPVAEPLSAGASSVDAESAVFADVDRAREQQVTAELAAGDPASGAYRGRHTA